MNYKSKLFNIVNKIITIIKKIEIIKLQSTNTIQFLKLQHLYSQLLQLFIIKETFELQFKEDIDSHIYYLHNKYNDHLALGYWEHQINFLEKSFNKKVNQ